MTEITISDELTDRIAHRIDRTEFESVDEYAEFVLSEVVARVEHDSDRSTESGESPGSREDVQGRLQSLGYLEE